MINTTAIFMEYVYEALSDVENQELVDSLLFGFLNNTEKIKKYIETYQEITNKQWTKESLCSFFCGWRNPDGAAHAVSSIIIRILQETENIQNSTDQLIMLDAARHCGEIIIEDVGLGELHGHPHHSKLYYRMATAICQSENWRLMEQFLNPITKEFSNWVSEKRPLAKNLIEAIEMMIFTELFNTGEYNLMTPMWKNWIRERTGYSAGEVNKIASFLSVHCGNVEARHFTHASNALILYAKATHQPINYARISDLSNEYVTRACEHLQKMFSVLKPVEHHALAE